MNIKTLKRWFLKAIFKSKSIYYLNSKSNVGFRGESLKRHDLLQVSYENRCIKGRFIGIAMNEDQQLVIFVTSIVSDAFSNAGDVVAINVGSIKPSDEVIIKPLNLWEHVLPC